MANPLCLVNPFDVISCLAGSYGIVLAMEDQCVYSSKTNQECNSFRGSYVIASLSANDSMELMPQACIAAPVVHLVAKQSLEMGVARSSTNVVRIFAPNFLSISTKHLTIGKVQFMTEPAIAAINCSRLTVMQYEGEENSALLEKLKSWMISDSTIVETKTPPAEK